MIRRAIFASLLCLSLPGLAQQPPKLEPLPEPPPAPPGVQDEALGERSVRITPGTNEKIEETVIEGRRVVRVTTPGGATYYLLDDVGEWGISRQSTDRGVRIPLWVIKEF